MKIAFILGEFPKLSTTFILSQITGLIDRGHNVTIFANKKCKRSDMHEDVFKYNLLDKTYYSNMPRNKFFRVIKAIGLILKNGFHHPLYILKSLNFIKYKKNALSLLLLFTAVNFLNHDNEYDIVHCHFGHNGVLGTILKDFGLIKGKLITTFHGSDVTLNYENKRKRYQIIFKNNDLCTVNSNFLKEKIIQLGCAKDKVERLPVGVDLDFFSKEQRNQINKNIDISILSVARLVEYKGLEYSIKAVSEIVKKHPKKIIKYYIVGDGKEKNTLQELINKLGLNECISLEGGKRREEVIKYYKKSNIFILPSISYNDGREEAQGLVLQEAQAMKLPVISTNIGGIPEGIINQKTGFIVKDKNVKELIEKIDFFIQNPHEIGKMGEAGREFIKNNFNQNELNNKLEEIYYNLIKNQD